MFRPGQRFGRHADVTLAHSSSADPYCCGVETSSLLSTSNCSMARRSCCGDYHCCCCCRCHDTTIGSVRRSCASLHCDGCRNDPSNGRTKSHRRHRLLHLRLGGIRRLLVGRHIHRCVFHSRRRILILEDFVIRLGEL